MHDQTRSTRTLQDGISDASDRRDRGAAGRPARLAEPLLDQIAGIRRFSRNGFVAPNKPLTLLWALARVEAGEPRLTPFALAEEELQGLLDDQGNPGTSPVHAFWRLQNDGVWEIVSSGELESSSPRKEPPLTAMRAYAHGGFTEPIYDALTADPALRRAVKTLLREQLHDSSGPQTFVPYAADARELVSRIKRHGAFKRGVIASFGARCGVCGWSVKKNGKPVALTAAHVRSREGEGEDEAGNGFVLCWLHHVLFDAGLFSYDEGRRLVVSSSWQEEGRGSMPSLNDFAGISMPEPSDPGWRVRDVHLAWHRDNVFAG